MSFNPEARHGEQIQFMATARGDGRVTWDSGIPPGVPTWYMDVEHGDMPAHPPSYQAFLQLLQRGTTNLLAQTAPVSRAVAELFVAPRAIDEIYPNAEELEASALGAGRRRRRRPSARSPVRYGPACQSRMASHTRLPWDITREILIISAEAHMGPALDGELPGAPVGLYPGAAGTSALFTNPRLHQTLLRRHRRHRYWTGNTWSLECQHAVTRILTGHAGLRSNGATTNAAARAARVGKLPPTLGLTTLLVGTGAGGVSVPTRSMRRCRAWCAQSSLCCGAPAQRIAGNSLSSGKIGRFKQ
jgi:hypothetical protein